MSGGTQVGRDVVLFSAQFESGHVHIPIFEEKVIHSFTNRRNFERNFDQNYLIFKIFLNLFWLELGTVEKKSTHYPFIYLLLHEIRGIDIPGGYFATHVCGKSL